MPLNTDGVEVGYTTNEEVGYLMDSAEKDYNVEFIGYITSVSGRSTVIQNGKERELFKCTITNGAYKLTLLIWDQEKIDELSGQLVADKILHLDGCEGQVVTKKRYHSNDLLNYEIIVQPGSTVEFKGFHNHKTENKVKTIPTVAFLDIPKAVGQIKVQGYIKTVVSAAYNREGPLGFGSGAITDGIHKLPVRVNAFKIGESANHTKGLCVMLTATVSRTEPFILTCQDMSAFELLDTEVPLDKSVVSKANKPLNKRAAAGTDASAKRLPLKQTQL